MEIFLDTADIDVIEKYKDFINGVTTNPSILSKHKNKSILDVALKISKLVTGPVSIEVISNDFDGMVKEGEDLSKIHQNICIKLPCTEDGLRACKNLSTKGISTNLTLCFSVPQAIMAATCGANGKTACRSRPKKRTSVGRTTSWTVTGSCRRARWTSFAPKILSGARRRSSLAPRATTWC